MKNPEESSIPIETSIYRGFFIGMFDHLRVPYKKRSLRNAASVWELSPFGPRDQVPYWQCYISTIWYFNIAIENGHL